MYLMQTKDVNAICANHDAHGSRVMSCVHMHASNVNFCHQSFMHTEDIL